MRVLLAFLFLVSSSAYAADAPNLLRNNQFEKELDGWFLKGADRCKSEATVTSHEKFQRALRLDVTPQAKDMPWSVVLRQTVGAPLQKGKQLVLKAWLRSPEQVQITAFVENAAPPYDKSLTATFRLTSEWQEYEIKGLCKEDMPPGGANCGFFLSHSKGTIRLADVRLFQTDKPVEAPQIEAPKIEPPKVELPVITPPKVETPPIEPPKIEPPIITPPTPAQVVEPLLEEEDFERQLTSWTLPENGTLKAEIAAANAGELPEQWTRVLKLSSDVPFDMATLRQRTISQKLIAAVAPGNGLQVKFWARGPRGARMDVRVGTSTNPAMLMGAQLDIKTEWKAYELRSIARTSLGAGQGQLSLVNGAVEGPLEIAGLQMERVSNVPRDWADAPPVFNLENLLQSEDFANGRWDANSKYMQQTVSGWPLMKAPGVTPEIVEADAGPYKSALRLTFNPPDPNKPLYYSLFQPFRTPPLTGEVFAFKFWARSTTENQLQIIVDQSEKRAPTPAGQTPDRATPLKHRTALMNYVPVSGDWREYTMRPDARLLKQLREKQDFSTEIGTCRINFMKPASTFEITGFRLALEQPAEP